MAARSPACRFGRTQTASSSGNRPFESTGRSAGTSTPREHCRNQDRKTARTELRELEPTDRMKLRRVRRLAAYSHRTVEYKCEAGRVRPLLLAWQIAEVLGPVFELGEVVEKDQIDFADGA